MIASDLPHSVSLDRSRLCGLPPLDFLGSVVALYSGEGSAAAIETVGARMHAEAP